MTNLSQALIENALSEIEHPVTGQSLKASGTLSAIIIDKGQIGIILDFGDMPISSIEGTKGSIEDIRSRVEKTVSNLEGVDAVNVVVTASKANKPTPASKPQTPPPPTPVEIPGVNHVVAVASGKGGVGKSTTSINLALALRDQRLKVGIMDADIFGPSLPTLVGLDDRPEIVNGVIQPLQKYGLKIMSIGFLIDVDQPIVWRGPRVMGAVQQLLKDVAWGPLDVLIVDMPPGTGDVQLSMVQNAPLSGAVIVSTPQDLALIDARKGLAMFRKVDVPIIGIIENMSSFICPSCGEESHIFGHGGAEDAAKLLDATFLGAIPLHMDIRALSDAGTPVVVTAPDGPHADIYRNIAKEIGQTLVLN
ncbi:Mrp/NBP35 family ATP-binding protein [Kordiimonas sp. SCSIO 12610]|uniref:Mrp/NBP35 family ATP-binding protein n=1 Tax=Kordiimonas sp. SCSIO 12610 TaxID=2829597 RepID=UPI0021097B16|nr:Mrp/NBP35 family ATP-binding protein [Kordiimonas sp. SCSIO 12610]UTW54428.1 Mrp/NBP35 family ATP-binding protein [Kordiimonas sp. SCSIO 12610]